MSHAVWTTFATIAFVSLAFSFNWRNHIVKKGNSKNKKVWVIFAVLLILDIAICFAWQKTIWSKSPQNSEAKIPKLISLKKLYEDDFDNLLRENQDRIIKHQDGTEVTINSKVYFDFQANSKFLGFYIPSTPITFDICVHLLEYYKEALKRGDENLVEWSQPGLQPMTNRDLKFSGRIYIYHEYHLLAKQKRKLYSLYESRELSVQFRGSKYAFEKPKNNTLTKE